MRRGKPGSVALDWLTTAEGRGKEPRSGLGRRAVSVLSSLMWQPGLFSCPSGASREGGRSLIRLIGSPQKASAMALRVGRWLHCLQGLKPGALPLLFTRRRGRLVHGYITTNKQWVIKCSFLRGAVGGYNTPPPPPPLHTILLCFCCFPLVF